MLKHTTIQFTNTELPLLAFNVVLNDQVIALSVEFNFDTNELTISDLDPMVADVSDDEPVVNVLDFVGIAISKAAREHFMSLG